MLDWLISSAEAAAAASDLMVRTTLTLRGGLPLWAGVVLGLLALALAAGSWPSLRRRVSRRLALLLAVMRAMALLAVVFFLLNPTLLRQTFQQVRPRIAMLLDTSRSMQISDGRQQRTRLQDVQQALADPALEVLANLREEFVVEPWQFAETLRPIPAAGLGSLSPKGNRTNILGALASLGEQANDAPLAGVVLVSDGAHNAGIMSEALLQRLRVPIATIGVGDPASFRDIRLAELKVPGFGFLHHPLSIEVDVVVDGFKGPTLPVVLKQEGRVMQTKVATLQSDRSRMTLSFGYTPRSIGEQHFSLSTPVQAGERIKTNNKLTFKINVVRDKIRVLLVCGSPSWNYRFLRRTLRGDPTVDVISFVILRTPFDQVNVPQEDLSLIPFPTDRLFTEELHNFDIIIFDNFSFRFYFPLHYLENLRKYVHGGGAFVMFGGDRSFSEGGYADSPVDDLLPVTLQRSASGYREGPFAMELTPAGMNHPITRLVDDEQENGSIWSQMPTLDGFNLAMRAKRNATVLGVHPAMANPFGKLPILAVMKYGRGRSLALLSDFFWKWNFQMIGDQKSNRHYLKLIRHMIRWLVNEPQFRQVRLFSAQESFEPGEEARLKVYVTGDDGGPSANAVLNVVATDPSGKKIDVPSSSAERPGEFNVRFKLSDAGYYRVSARATINGKDVGENHILLPAKIPDWELRDAAINESLLKRLARQSGGIYTHLTAFDVRARDQLRQIFQRQFQPKVIEESRWKVWRSLYTFIALLLLLSCEWFLRRRSGLL